MSIVLVGLVMMAAFVPLISPNVKSTDMGGNFVSVNGYLVPHYFGPYPNYATSDLPRVTYNLDGSIASLTGGIRKFVDSLPGLGPAAANNLGNYISVAVPDTTTYPGSEYYEIALVEYEQKMHSDLNPTKLRGYVQLETADNYDISKHVALHYLDGTSVYKGDPVDQIPAIAIDEPRYLGPFIIAQKDVPVRVKFYNLLPIGQAGDLFIPVDKTAMGAGETPTPGEYYTENRATIHLHGGRTPWISDGTPHQWITPAGEYTNYPEGVSVRDVPDMPDPGPGAMTFFYTNQQSARLMFYHDHAYGITRLNVYAGEAAGYLLVDDVEKSLITAGIIPADEIPLVIQDKTFVPNTTVPVTNMWGTFDSQLAFQDPTWNTTQWGQEGDLWYPHVYMTMTNPYDPTGMNPFGRWHYLPWFWPPQQPVFGPIANPYYDPNNPMEPVMIPGTPNPSQAGEAFMDTPVINGVAYPYLEIDPQAYRFRILNAADDRFFNLQLYVADSSVVSFDGRNNTEVKMVPAVPTDGFPVDWPTDGRAGGVPDPATAGPEMIQIGTEGGFLPSPVILPNQPVDWNWDMGTFDMGILKKYTLLLGSAERADVIIDFSQFAGKTLILYNDCPAPSPAGDPRQDYYTGHPDMTDTGGSATTLPGYGSNTRTLMQIRVANTTPAQAFNVSRLMDAFNTTADHVGVFAEDQHDIIIPQSYYDSAYNLTLPTDSFVRIYDTSVTFTPLGTTTPVTIEMKNKAIHDEMGAAFDPLYGRMAVEFGVEVKQTQAQVQNLVLYGYTDPPTEVIAPDIYGTQIGALSDGTQIWKIVHNGVDVHPVHWHMFEVQLINRVAWDNNIREPDPNELGWKETIRVNPLQNTIVALRPVIPNVPFDLPNSVRLMDPTKPEGVILDTQAFAPNAEPITIVNRVVNFGWEYVWHCHILAHEENDMMRTMAVAIAPRAPSNLVISQEPGRVVLNWQDNSLGETGFTIQRAEDPEFQIGLTTFTVAQGVTTYNDTTAGIDRAYYYRVFADNLVGDTTDYRTLQNNPLIENFPTVKVSSAPTNVVSSPLGLTMLLSAVPGPSGSPVTLTWTYAPSGAQTGFVIERASNMEFTQGVVRFVAGPSAVSYTDGLVQPSTIYYYRVAATSGGVTGAWSNIMVVTTP
jgi:FtsP/CotA-like multicopper oxidase with cupredoxin domain